MIFLIILLLSSSLSFGASSTTTSTSAAENSTSLKSYSINTDNAQLAPGGVYGLFKPDEDSERLESSERLEYLDFKTGETTPIHTFERDPGAYFWFAGTNKEAPVIAKIKNSPDGTEKDVLTIYDMNNNPPYVGTVEAYGITDYCFNMPSHLVLLATRYGAMVVNFRNQKVKKLTDALCQIKSKNESPCLLGENLLFLLTKKFKLQRTLMIAANNNYELDDEALVKSGTLYCINQSSISRFAPAYIKPDMMVESVLDIEANSYHVVNPNKVITASKNGIETHEYSSSENKFEKTGCITIEGCKYPRALNVSKDNKRAVVVTGDSQIAVVDLEKGKIIRKIDCSIILGCAKFNDTRSAVICYHQIDGAPEIFLLPS